MDEAKLHLTSFFLEEKKSFKHLSVGTFHILYIHVMTKYDLHETLFYTPVSTIRGRFIYGTTALKPGPLAVAYQIEPIILRYIEINPECGQPMNRLYVVDYAKSLITGSNLVNAMNRFHHSN